MTTKELITIIESQDSWDTPEMDELIRHAEKEGLNSHAYDDPDRLYTACLEVLKGERKAVTKAWKVYGETGHRQRESFCYSYRHDFSSEKDGTRLIEVLNSDRTGTNDYTIVVITRNTEAECIAELEGQISDGIFENSRTGDVEELERRPEI